MDIEEDCVSELNELGLEFVKEIFLKYDKDRDNALSPQEFLALFSLCPILPFTRREIMQTQLTKKGYLSFQGFLALWQLQTFLDPQKTLTLLAYLGFPINTQFNQSAAISTPLRTNNTNRTVFKCIVLGPLHVGKTTLCQGFIKGETRAPDFEDTSKYTCKNINISGQMKYLIMEDTDVSEVFDFLLNPQTCADIACLLYDVSQPNSFAFSAHAYLNYFTETQIPILFIGNKVDLGEVGQKFSEDPKDFVKRYKLPQPLLISATQSDNEEIYKKLGEMVSGSDSGETTRFNWLGAGLGIAITGSVLFLLFRFIKANAAK